MKHKLTNFGLTAFALITLPSCDWAWDMPEDYIFTAQDRVAQFSAYFCFAGIIFMMIGCYSRIKISFPIGVLLVIVAIITLFYASTMGA